MKIKIQLFKVFLIFFLYAYPVYAQQVVGQENSKEIFRTAMELFNAENYGAALPLFQKLLGIAEPVSVLAQEADYHIRVCYLEMGNSNGKAMLESFISSNPESPRINNAWFRLGNPRRRAGSASSRGSRPLARRRAP